MVVIVVYAIYMSIDMDLNKPEVAGLTNPIFLICEQIFCLYFFLELLIRFLAFERKCNCLKDGWFVFDLTLVILMVAETWVWSLVTFRCCEENRWVAEVFVGLTFSNKQERASCQIRCFAGSARFAPSFPGFHDLNDIGRLQNRNIFSKPLVLLVLVFKKRI